MSIPVSDLIAIFHQMLSEHWAYAWDGAEKGRVGCAGAFVYAYRKHGLSLYNGSNRIQRTACGELLPISEARPGMAAFKRRVMGDKGYSLPDAYQPGGSHYNGDLSDYYHIGLVDDDPDYVLNAQGTATGFVRSKITENWYGVAYLNAVDYGEAKEEPEMKYAKVIGGALRMRKGPGTSYDVIRAVKDGEQVEVLTDAGGWAYIRAGHESGYVMSQYLQYTEAKEQLEEEPEEGTFTVSKRKWDKLMESIEEIKEDRRNAG